MRRILWFRRDLRVEDNPLLSLEGDVLPLFIFDPNILEKLKSDDRRITFIFSAVMHLKSELQRSGRNLAIFYGKPTEVFRWLLAHGRYDEVCASGDYDPYALERDRDISHLLPFHPLNDTYIFHPDDVLKNDGTPYLVFTPFYNRAKTIFRAEHSAAYANVPQNLIDFEYDDLYRIEDEQLTKHPISLPSIGFEAQLLTAYQRMSPHDKLAIFASKLEHYPHNRDFMALEGTSGLSTDLRFGKISIRAVLRWLIEQKGRGIDTEPFFRQLIFRDFYAMLL
ncbi:MAG: deoxyribodipyrimidine photo-lyase, partial [Sulfuricurvum sp.]|nr:deoxyribodipyrimidine photo-lyase [Sulfuricurvum sp.]